MWQPATVSQHVEMVDLAYELPSLFRPLTISRISLRLQRSRSNWSATSTSFTNVNWLGSDLGNFLYWFGEWLLDLWAEVVIHVRLMVIHSTLVRKGVAEHFTDVSRASCAQRICEDLLELCRCVVRHFPATGIAEKPIRIRHNPGIVIRSNDDGRLFGCFLKC